MSLQNAFEDLAVASKQDTANASLGNIETDVDGVRASAASIDAKLPALDGGRIPVALPPGGGGLTNSELRASPVPIAAAGGDQLGTEDTLREIARALSHLPMMFEASNASPYSAGTGAAMRVVWGNTHNINNIAGVATVTNQAQMGGIPVNYDQYYQAWNYEAALIKQALL